MLAGEMLSMCLRGPPGPVFIDGGGATTPLLDDFFGWTIADGIRSLAGFRPLHAYTDSPFGVICGGAGEDSYLQSAFSSLLTLGVVLLSFAVGALLSSRRKRAVAIGGAGLVISLLDTGIRFAQRFGRAPDELRDLMIGGLPIQLAANFLFQMLLPCVAAVLLVRLAGAVRAWAAGIGRP